MTSKVLIIAEAGINHNGSMKMAKELINKAKECGADMIKFQTAKLDSLVSKYAQMADYQKANTGKTESQKDMLERLLLQFEDFEELSEYCRKKGIIFLSTPFDIESIHFLKDLIPFWKVPSGEITDYPYLVEIAKTHKPVILSTGMSNLKEIAEALEVLNKNGTEDVILLHCNTQYPTPYGDVNLRAMNTIAEQFGVKVGYSDHTSGIEVPIAAVAMGASVIEKHFTLDKTLSGPDHKASLEPHELRAMVDSIRHIEVALGTGEKVVTKSEMPNMAIARKSIIASKKIKKGEILTKRNLTTKRPGTGISPMRWNEVLGMAAVRDFMEDELIEL